MVRDLLGLLWSFSMIQASEITRESSSGIPGTYYKQWTWSVWYDTFFGHEQTETYDAIVKKGWKICPNKEDLAASECRIKDTGETISYGYFFNTSALLGTNLECKLNGIECHHSRCMNFEVRFLCEELMVESGSAVFYFTLLAVPVTLILFRLYCWDKIKKRYLKRLRNRPLTRTNVNDTTDNSRFDPPSYEELFGPLTTPSYNEVHASPIEMSINQTDAGCSGWSHTSADNNMCLNIRDSLSPSACTRNKIQMHEFRSDDGAAHVHQFYAIRGHINSCYVSDDVQGRGAGNFSGENTSISVITSDINDVPPPSYAEALVILKRTEGLDATHL